MAQDGALVLALDSEVYAFAEARTVDCRFAHVERYGLRWISWNGVESE